MLLDYYVENFRSIGGEQHVSLSANNGIRDTPKEGDPDYGVHRASSLVKYVKVMAFYGYNSSGKTNLFLSMNRMKSMIIHSIRLNDGEHLPYEPFSFGGDWENKPTSFRVVFMKDTATYEYGFSYNANAIVSEQLYLKIPGRSRKLCFNREYSKIEPDEAYMAEFSVDAKQLNANRLLISLAGQLGGQVSNEVLGWFRTEFDALSGSRDESFGAYTQKVLLENASMASEVKEFIGKFNLGFNDLWAKQIDVDQIQFPAGIPAEILAQIKSQPIIELNTKHAVYDEQGKVLSERSVSLDNYESEGTIKLVHMSGVLARALHDGSTIAIDEFDARIHPNICKEIVNIFNSSESNPHGAQLLITTHDTNLMSNKIFRRDQICFVKQDCCAHSIVYPLMEVTLANGQAPRNDSNYEKNYLSGLYDNIPDGRNRLNKE
ncbi:MAG: ATP-binding protein [Paludibacteraceae bacterium]|nr:ATP-binding protein [Paludibacteraceae bacterium]